MRKIGGMELGTAGSTVSYYHTVLQQRIRITGIRASIVETCGTIGTTLVQMRAIRLVKLESAGMVKEKLITA